MGTFSSSYSFFNAHHHDVRELVARWLRSKGFEEMPGPRLFALDGAHERGLTLVWNERWTTLQYSNIGEEERLFYELHKLERPVLHMWVHDSDLWGYELAHQRRVVAAFNSNPRYFGPAEEPEADNDLEVLCRLCGLEGAESELRKLQRQRAVFKEESCRSFADRLGASAAALSYDDLAVERAPLAEGCSNQHLWFRHYDFDPMAGFNLHRIDARCGARPTGPLPGMEDHYRKIVGLVGEEKAREAWQRITGMAEQTRQGSGDRFAEVEGRSVGEVEDESGADPGLPPGLENQRREIEHQMRRMKWQMGCLSLLSRPLVWLMKPAMSLLMWRYSRRSRSRWKASDGSIGPVSKPHFRSEEGWLINDQHQCRLRLAAGAEASETLARPATVEPVFVFSVGGVPVWCTSERAEAVRWRITGWPHGTELKQENTEVGGDTAKLIVAEGSRGERSFVELLYLIQTPEGVYVFQTEPGAEPSAWQQEAFRSTVESFRREAS